MSDGRWYSVAILSNGCPVVNRSYGVEQYAHDNAADWNAFHAGRSVVHVVLSERAMTALRECSNWC